MSKINFKQTEIGEIPENWSLLTIDDVAEVVGGGTPSTKDLSNFGGDIPWITPKDLSKFSFRYISRGERNITQRGLEESSAKLLPPNTVLLTTRAPVGYVAIAKNEVTTNQGFRSLIPRKNVNAEYLYYLLKINTERLKSNASGTTFGELSGSTLKSLKFSFPPIAEQRAIAKILSDLDEKIELNNQMNKTLEAIGQAIFKRWFVDFEFPDKNGKPYKSSGGGLVDSELGEIPEGWTVSNLEDIGTFKNGINYLRNETGDTEFSIANVRDIANNKLLLKESLDKIKINLSKAREYLLQEKDILIARSASPGEISLVLGNLENVIYSGFSIRYRLNNSNNYLYIFHVMQGLKRNLQNYSIGTTLQSVNQETLKNMRIILPSDETLKEFNKISQRILDKTLNNLLQNMELSQIRDSLLPRLISGRIRVG